MSPSRIAEFIAEDIVSKLCTNILLQLLMKNIGLVILWEKMLKNDTDNL